MTEDFKQKENIFSCQGAIYGHVVYGMIILFFIAWPLFCRLPINWNIVIIFIAVFLVLSPISYFWYRWYEVSSDRITVSYLFGWQPERFLPSRLRRSYPSIIKLAEVKKMETIYRLNPFSFFYSRWAKIILSDNKIVYLPFDNSDDLARFNSLVGRNLFKLGITAFF